MAEPTVPLNQHWIDILPPGSSSPDVAWWLIASVCLLLLVLLVVYLLRRHAPRQQAHQVLQRCRRQLCDGGADTRRLAREVYAALLRGLALTPATARQACSGDAGRWQSFYFELQRCVFGPGTPSVADLTQLIGQARSWLRRYPG